MMTSALITAFCCWAKAPDYMANKVRSVFTHDGILIIGCENATSDGIRYFAAVRGEKHFDEARDSAWWVLEKDRPLGVLYRQREDNDWRGCDKPDCRGMIGVERR